MLKISAALIVMASLSACGGGGGGGPASQDNTAAIAQQSVANIASSVPTPSKYTGSFIAIAGAPAGFFSASSPDSLVRGIANNISADPAKYADLYRLLISSAGLQITLYGETLPAGPSGLARREADTVYTVKLTSSGLVVTF